MKIRKLLPSLKRISIFLLTSLCCSLILTQTSSAAFVDIMIVYDNTATAWVANNGTMKVFSQNTVSRMNQALQNSGIDSDSFRLVHSMSVDYTTTSDGSTSMSLDLSSLQGGTGNFAVVHTARNTYGADLVAMMVDTGSAYGYVGFGYVLWNYSGTPDFGFTVNSIRSVEISQTLTHEVGHNLGAHHSKYQAQSPGPNNYLDGQYSAGWYFTGTNTTDYHTIMAYNFDGKGGRYVSAPLFSTPLIDHEGTATGDEQDADNTRLIKETIETIAAYRSSTISLTSLSISGATSVNEGSTANYTTTASWSDGSTSTVTPTWSENSTYTTVSTAGVLTASVVTANQAVTISASYTSGGITKTDTHTVTVVDISVKEHKFPWAIFLPAIMINAQP